MKIKIIKFTDNSPEDICKYRFEDDIVLDLYFTFFEWYSHLKKTSQKSYCGYVLVSYKALLKTKSFK